MMLPHWKRIDVANLHRRVLARLTPQPLLTPGAAPGEPQVTTCTRGCATGDHSHAARRVGSFWECLCLNCTTLTLTDWVVLE